MLHAKTAVTKKVRGHFKRLLKPLKLEGLWSWAEVSRDLHKAGIPVLSGTLPVEMFWAGLVSMLPPQAKKVTLRWFRILADLALLRHNSRLFACGAWPQWTEQDSLLSHQLALFTSICQMLHDDHQQPNHLQNLFDPFDP